MPCTMVSVAKLRKHLGPIVFVSACSQG